MKMKRMISLGLCLLMLAALPMSALAAEGETVISGCSYIRRGYEHICRDLAAVGGRIEEKTGKVLYENIQIQEKNNIN